MNFTADVLYPLGWREIRITGDLLAMRTYFDCGLVDVGIIVTRSAELNEVFREMNILSKYGASTTWMGKLLNRLDSRRNGGCPILAVGIRKSCVKDYEA